MSTSEKRHRKNVGEFIQLDELTLRELTAANFTQSEIGVKLGCSSKTVAARMRDYGIQPLKAVARDPRGERGSGWKGDRATYGGFHQRVQKIRGKPSQCEVCGLTDPTKRYEWANLTGKFNDPSDYRRMCVKCHRAHDGYSPLFVQQEKAEWSVQHSCCKQCGTTAKKHSAHGLCSSCYSGQQLPKAAAPPKPPNV